MQGIEKVVCTGPCSHRLPLRNFDTSRPPSMLRSTYAHRAKQEGWISVEADVRTSPTGKLSWLCPFCAVELGLVECDDAMRIKLAVMAAREMWPNVWKGEPKVIYAPPKPGDYRVPLFPFDEHRPVPQAPPDGYWQQETIVMQLLYDRIPGVVGVGYGPLTNTVVIQLEDR